MASKSTGFEGIKPKGLSSTFSNICWEARQKFRFTDFLRIALAALPSLSAPGIRFENAPPSRRKHVLIGWLPRSLYLPGPPLKAKRVRTPEDLGLLVGAGLVHARFMITAAGGRAGAAGRNFGIDEKPGANEAAMCFGINRLQ